jgi:hypothetical protein
MAIDFSDQLVVAIREVNIAGGHRVGAEQHRGSRGHAVPAIVTEPGKGGDDVRWGNYANAITARIGDVEAAAAIHGQTRWKFEQTRACRASIPAESLANSGKRGYPAIGSDGPNPTAIGVGQVNDALAIHRDSRWVSHGRREGRTTVSTRRIGAVSGEGGDDSTRRKPAKAVVLGIRYQDAALGIDRDGRRLTKRGLSGGPVIAAESAGATTSHCIDFAVGRDTPDTVVVAIRNIQIAGGIDGQTVGMTQRCRRGGTAVTFEYKRTVSGEGRNFTVRSYLADKLKVVAKVQIPRAVYGDARGTTTGRLRGRTAIARLLSGGAAARDGGDSAIGSDFANTISIVVSDINISAAGGRHGLWI